MTLAALAEVIEEEEEEEEDDGDDASREDKESSVTWTVKSARFRSSVKNP
jgi:hypothetical protein